MFCTYMCINKYIICNNIKMKKIGTCKQEN